MSLTTNNLIMSNISKELTNYITDETELELINQIILGELEEYIIHTKAEGTVILKDSLDAADIFLNYMATIGRSPNTIKLYKIRLYNFLSYIKRPVSEIRTSNIQDYLDYKKSQPCKNTTLNNIRIIINVFFTFLKEQEYIEKNPCEKIHCIKTEQTIKEVFTRDELDRIRAATLQTRLKERNLAIVDFLISTGCRASELVNLKKSELDLDNKICKIWGKGSKERYAFLTNTAKDSLQKYFNTRTDDNPYVFKSIRSDHLTVRGLETQLDRIGKLANVSEIYPHKFRRTAITNLLNNGASIEKVAIIMGHNKIDTTKQYYYVAKIDDLKKEFDNFTI